MAGFAEIIGHEQIIEHLQNAIKMDKISHAYILNGPDKSGKKMLAEAFAQTLQCEQHGIEPCFYVKISNNNPAISPILSNMVMWSDSSFTSSSASSSKFLSTNLTIP